MVIMPANVRYGFYTSPRILFVYVSFPPFVLFFFFLLLLFFIFLSSTVFSLFFCYQFLLPFNKTNSFTPVWSYDESYYRTLIEGTSYCIKTDPVKGKGLFSRRKICEGDIVHEETALCCSQNLDDVLNPIPVCGNCLLSLESSRRCAARVIRKKALVSKLPYAKLETHSRSVNCMFAEQGCTMVFCSVRCREAAWSRFHFAGCQGRMTEEQKKAYNKFIKHNWEHKGVNYSDTVFLAFRFLCMTITNIRLHKKPLGIAYKSVSQLIKAPLSLFQFSYLLSDDAPNDQDEEVQLRKRWELFQKLREQSVPSQGDDATEEFLSFGIELVDKILQFTEEERSCFTSSTWSELLGAVLLNGQERSPPSNYDYLKEVVRGMPGGLAAMNAFEEQVQEAGVDPQQLHYSSRGQGIYTIGCLFNHSCEPNLQVLYSCVNDETLTVEAIRDIEPGEELLISYIDESLPYPDRQQQLYEHYLFTCRCPKCESESHDWERVATKIGDHSPSISSTL